MKKSQPLVLLLFVAFSFFSKNSSAQIDVTINPIGALFGNLSIGGDFAIAENISVEGVVGFGSSDSNGFDYKAFPITAFGKYYFNPNRGTDKFYASAWLRFVSRSYEYSGDSGTVFSDYTQTRFGLGFGVGYKIVAKKGLVFDIGLGGGRSLVDNTSYDDENGNTFEVDWTNIMIVGKLGIGYRFGG